MESRKIKVLMLVATIVGTTILTAIPSTLAAEDTFDITVKGEYITISVSPAAWDVNDGSAVAMSTAYYTDAAHENNNFTADATGSSVTVNLQLQITTEGSTWKSAASEGSPASNKYTLYADSAGEGLTYSHQIINSTTTLIASGVSTTKVFALNFNSPTSTTTGEVQTITVTLTAISGS